MSVNAANTTPTLRTNHVNNSLLKRAEKNRIAQLLTNITGRDGVWVRNKANRIEIGLRKTSNHHHAFHFAPTSPTAGTISQGLLYYQAEKQDIVEASAALVDAGTYGPWTVTPGASHTHFYIEIDTSGTPSFQFLSGTSFPDGGEEKLIFPVLEFTDYADMSSAIEHQQSTIHALIPCPKGTGYNGALVVNDGVIEWKYADADYKLLQRKADDSIDFDYPRFNAAAP